VRASDLAKIVKEKVADVAAVAVAADAAVEPLK